MHQGSHFAPLSILAKFFLHLFLLIFSSAVYSNINLFLDENEGGKIKPRNVKAFSSHMDKYNCPVTWVENRQDADVFLAVESMVTQAQSFQAQVKVKTYNDLPLNSSVLVKRSTAVSSLAQLKNMRIAIINAASHIGFLAPYPELNAQGLNIEEMTVMETKRYEGAMALLLHGDVFTAIIPTPLAEKWLAPNKLKIIAQSQIKEHPFLWFSNTLKPETMQQCTQAFAALSTRKRRDQRMNVFPLWVEGFSLMEESSIANAAN